MRLVVRLLGGVEVILDGQRLRAFSSPRLHRFLGLIALSGEPQHRSRLAFTLWPDSTDSQARTNLRKLLHEFRQSLPDVEEFVDFDKETVRWKSAGPSEVDVLSLRNAMAAGDLELAARLYAGDLLPACYDDWVLEERARLEADVFDALSRLASQAEDRNDPKAAIKYAQHMLAMDPTDENAVLLQLRAQFDTGDKAAAIRCYHRYAEVLEQELAVAPGDEIENLYRQLRQGSSGRRDEHGASRATLAESSLIGREKEWELLSQLWNRAQQEGAHFAVISGEAGVGKSRLATELGRGVRAAGHLVASARAYEAAGRLPWGPVVELLRSESLRDSIDGLERVWQSEIARLLPEILDDADAGAPQLSEDPIQRHRLFDAVSRAVIAGDRPRLLIIDDLQWCDAETIEMIGFVVRAEASAPVLILGTVREEDLPDGHPLRSLIDALSRDNAVTTVALDRLDEAATAKLAAQTLRTDQLDPQMSTRLWRETEGNPLFVIETVRAGATAEDDQAVITPTIRALLSSRLDQLEDVTRQVAETAAVVGRPFSVGLIAAASKLPEPDVIEHLDDLWRRRIIREHGHFYDFTHDKLRAVTLESISSVRRRRLHRTVASAIEAESGGNAAEAAPQLAAHYDQAGMVDAAIDAYRIAGAQAVAVSASEEAVSMFQRALSLLAELPASSERDALELDIRIALGSPLVALEGYGSPVSHSTYERARSLCRKLARPVNPPILRGMGLARLQGCRFDQSSELGQALVDHESGDPVAVIEGKYLLGVSAFWEGDLDRSRHYLQAAIDAYDVSHRNEHLALYAQDPKAVCLVRLAWVDLWEGDLARADQNARAALEIACDLDHHMTLAYVITYAAIVAAESEDLERLGELLAEAEEVWQRLSDRYLIVVLEALRAWTDVLAGSAGAIDRILECVSRSRAKGETLHLTYTLLLLARARARFGEYREGRAATREALTLTDQYNQHYLASRLRRLDAELATHLGESG